MAADVVLRAVPASAKMAPSAVDASAVDVPCRILLPTHQAELVAGPKDASVRKLRAESGANVQVFREKLLPASFHARGECLVIIKCDDGRQLRAAVSGTLHRAFDISGMHAVTTSRDSLNNKDGVEERQRTLEVMIPEVACRHIVGAGGDRIKLLRRESRCEVHLAPGAVGGFDAQKRLRCGGSFAEVTEAVARIHEVLVEFASIGILHPRHFDLQEVAPVGDAAKGSMSSKICKVPVRLLVSKDECGWLIGKRGNKIHKYRELALLSTRESDQDLMRLGSESVVDIFGAPLMNQMCVLQLIVDDLAMMGDPSLSTRLAVPSELGQAVSPRLEEVRQNVEAPFRIEERGAWHVVEICGPEAKRLITANVLHELFEETFAAQSRVQAENGSRAQKVMPSELLEAPRVPLDEFEIKQPQDNCKPRVDSQHETVQSSLQLSAQFSQPEDASQHSVPPQTNEPVAARLWEEQSQQACKIQLDRHRENGADTVESRCSRSFPAEGESNVGGSLVAENVHIDGLACGFAGFADCQPVSAENRHPFGNAVATPRMQREFPPTPLNPINIPCEIARAPPLRLLLNGPSGMLLAQKFATASFSRLCGAWLTVEAAGHEVSDGGVLVIHGAPGVIAGACYIIQYALCFERFANYS